MTQNLFMNKTMNWFQHLNIQLGEGYDSRHTTRSEEHQEEL
jgi:hypothetical protein